MTERKKFPIKGLFAFLIFSLLYFLAVIVFVAYRWSALYYQITVGDLLFTITSPMDGTGTEIFVALAKYCAVYAAAAAAPWLLTVFIVLQRKYRIEIGIKLFSHKFTLGMRGLRRALCVLSGLLFLFSLSYALVSMEFPQYLRKKSHQTTIYEDYYVDHLSTEIKAPEEKKNLLYIYLESMEISYASREDGGFQDENYMPELTALAEEYISFSDKEGLGGFVSVPGTTWTMGALMATGAGVPFAFPTGTNNMNRYSSFAPNLVAMGDILAQQGYTQEFLCGSDVNFGGRELYFTEHGKYDFFDYYTAKEKGYIPQDYRVWWGFEDLTLYDIAKDELLRLSAEDKPFNLTMLTVDAHHIEGYVCQACPDSYDSNTANVIACSDRQLADFIDWCKQQDFYEDTLIVVSGDHPRMDTFLVDGLDYMSRTMYNCFINAASQPAGSTKNRSFTALDIFPTVLSAMGFEIEGDRLGLGTDMFSGRATLAEELGLDWLCGELDKGSDYYLERFS